MVALAITVGSILAVPAVFFIAFVFGMGIGVLSGDIDLYRLFADASLLTVIPFGVTGSASAWVFARRDMAWGWLALSGGLSAVPFICTAASIHFFYG
jgi:hypothetical protein